MKWFGVRTTAVALGLALGLTVLPVHAAGTEPPAPGTSKRVDEIKERGALRVAAHRRVPLAAGEHHRLRPAVFRPRLDAGRGIRQAARREARDRAGQPRDEGADPGDRRGRHLDRAAGGDAEARRKVVDFIVYSQSSLCMFGLADNPKLEGREDVDDLNREDITMAYFTGTPPETWAPTRFPKVKLKGVAGLRRQCAGRGDHGQARRHRPHRQRRLAAARQAGARASSSSRPATNACRATRWRPTSASRSTRRTPVFRDWLQAVYDEMKDKVDGRGAARSSRSRLRIVRARLHAAGQAGLAPAAGPPVANLRHLAAVTSIDLSAMTSAMLAFAVPAPTGRSC